MPAPLRVIHKTDPKEDILHDVGHLVPHFQPIAAGVFIVMYERGNQKGGGEVTTQGGIIVPSTATGALAEDKYQGKVGLVMALGPIAFEEDASHKWGNAVPQVGDWVMISVGDTYSFDLPGPRRARLVEDVNVKFIVSPEAFDSVW
jgi:co-chaperonin GroES (HSP10)